MKLIGLFLSLAAVSVKAKKPFGVPKQQRSIPHEKEPLTPYHQAVSKTNRGGEFPLLKPNTAGKVNAAAHVFQGAAFLFLPKQMAEFFGWGTSDSALAATELMGSVCMALGLSSGASHFLNANPIQAFGVGCASFTLSCLRWLVNKALFQAGMPISMLLGGLLAPSVLGAYAGLAETSWAPTLLYFFVLVFGTAGCLSFLNPELSLKLWQINSTVDVEKVQILVRGQGHFLLASQIHNLLLQQGLSPSKAIGSVSLSALVHTVYSLFVSKHAVTVADPTGYWLWLVFFAVFSAASLL